MPTKKTGLSLIFLLFASLAVFAWFFVLPVFRASKKVLPQALLIEHEQFWESLASKQKDDSEELVQALFDRFSFSETRKPFLSEFVRQRDKLIAQLGNYQKTIDVQVDKKLAGDGKTGWVLKSSLLFDKGRFPASLSIIEESKTSKTENFTNKELSAYKISGYSISLPDEDTFDWKPKALPFPDELVGLLENSIRKSFSGQSEEVWNATSDAFKMSISPEEFAKISAILHGQWGTLRSSTVKIARMHPSEKSANATLLLRFTGGECRAQFDLLQEVKGEWKIHLWKIPFLEPSKVENWN